MTDFTHLTDDYDEAEDFANAVQDALTGYASGTSGPGVARASYDVVMKLLGFPTDEDDDE